MADEAYFGSKHILAWHKPTIQLDEIAIFDTESDDQQFTVSEDNAKPSKVIGNIAPYVRINGFTFDHTSILDMTLDERGLLPKINITLRDMNGVFKSAYFPKTRPVLNLYIRSKHDKLKCIRCDFLITTIYSDSSMNPEDHMLGENMDLSMSGTLLVPDAYYNSPKSYSNMTSLEVLEQISIEMQLGFATNESYTNDRMTWVKPLLSKLKFIDKIAMHAFSNDESFYASFIDKHYHLNFINVAKMFEETGDFDELFERVLTYADIYTKQSDENNMDDDVPIELVLTNYQKFAGSDMFISEYRPNSSQGNMLTNSGYSRKVQYYDQQLSDNPAENTVTLNVSPISNTLQPDSENETNDSLKSLATNNSYGEWAGIDYNNGHDNFNFARIQNVHNNDNIRKITLYIKMEGVNMNLIRGMRVPVLILRDGQDGDMLTKSVIPDSDISDQTTEQNDAIDIMKDKWLSGYYVIGSLSYTYDAYSGFVTEATLYRLNWDVPEAVLPDGNSKNK